MIIHGRLRDGVLTDIRCGPAIYPDDVPLDANPLAEPGMPLAYDAATRRAIPHAEKIAERDRARAVAAARKALQKRDALVELARRGAAVAAELAAAETDLTTKIEVLRP